MKQQHQVHWLNNPFDFSDVTRYPVESNTTIQQFVDDHGGIKRLNRMPTVCVYQGRELMRAEYGQTIEADVCFVTMPTGGDSGSNPLQLAAMLALTVYTGGLAAGWAQAGWSSMAIAGAANGYHGWRCHAHQRRIPHPPACPAPPAQHRPAPPTHCKPRATPPGWVLRFR